MPCFVKQTKAAILHHHNLSTFCTLNLRLALSEMQTRLAPFLGSEKLRFPNRRIAIALAKLTDALEALSAIDHALEDLLEQLKNMRPSKTEKPSAPVPQP